MCLQILLLPGYAQNASTIKASPSESTSHIVALLAKLKPPISPALAPTSIIISSLFPACCPHVLPAQAPKEKLLLGAVVPESGRRNSGNVYSLESAFIGVLLLLMVLVGDGEDEKVRPGRLDEDEEKSTEDVDRPKVFEDAEKVVAAGLCPVIEGKDDDVGVDVAGSSDGEVEEMVLRVSAGALRIREGRRDIVLTVMAVVGDEVCPLRLSLRCLVYWWTWTHLLHQ
jgi:hypothetical protein